MITILADSPNIIATDDVLPTLEKSYAEMRKLLPELPEAIDIWLIHDFPLDSSGVSGFAYSPSIITIDFNPDFADKQLQQKALRATVFHEAYHLVQGHTGEDGSAVYTSALDSAIYEGMATVFERKYANLKEPYGDYSTTDESLLQKWQSELTKITPEGFIAEDGKLWRQWAFYDESDDYGWKLYKTGAWIVDRYLEKSGEDILDIVHMPAADIAAAVKS